MTSPMTQKKDCPGCNRLLPLEAYGKDKHAKGGVTKRCRECIAARRREIHRANPEKNRRKFQRWYYSDLERSREIGREGARRRAEARPDEVRKYRNEQYRRKSAEVALGAHKFGDWTESEDEYILNSGESASEMAKRMGRTLAAVMGRRQWLLDREGALSASRKSRRSAYEETLPRASSRGAPWTSVEVNIAADYSRTSKEVALVLGRTLYGVNTLRSRLNAGDPKITSMLET